MWVLWFYIAMIVGGHPQAYKVGAPFVSKDACEIEMLSLWKDMDDSYPLNEHVLYWFDCKPEAKKIVSWHQISKQ